MGKEEVEAGGERINRTIHKQLGKRYRRKRGIAKVEVVRDLSAAQRRPNNNGKTHEGS